MRTFGSILKIIAKSALMIAKETRKSHACHRAAGSGSVLAIGFLFLVSLVLSAVLAALGKYMSSQRERKKNGRARG
jgi:hypothetical protein